MTQAIRISTVDRRLGESLEQETQRYESARSAIGAPELTDAQALARLLGKLDRDELFEFLEDALSRKLAHLAHLRSLLDEHRR